MCIQIWFVHGQPEAAQGQPEIKRILYWAEKPGVEKTERRAHSDEPEWIEIDLGNKIMI